MARFSRTLLQDWPTALDTPGRPPATGLARSDDAPTGRILIVAHDTVIALDLQRMLRDAGYRIVGPAASRQDAARLIALGAIDGAVVDVGDNASEASDIVGLLQDRGIPFALLATDRTQAGTLAPAAPVIEKPFAQAEVLSALERALSRPSDEHGTDDNDGFFYRPEPAPMPWPRVMPQL